MLPFFESGLLVDEIRGQGYAVKSRNAYTEHPGKTSSFAIPVSHDGRLLACLTLIFFSVALKLPKAVELFLPDLRKTASGQFARI